MEAEAQLSAMLEIRETGLDLTATYHSHPRTPAEASARDLALAAYPDSFHLIVSLANGRPEIRCYRITEQEGCRPRRPYPSSAPTAAEGPPGARRPASWRDGPC